VYGIPVKIWDEWVKDSGIDEEITLLNVQALSGADAKNRLKGRVNCPMAGGAKVSLSMGVQVGMAV